MRGGSSLRHASKLLRQKVQISGCRNFYSPPSKQSPSPGLNSALQLDPALQQLLQDTDLSLLRSRKRSRHEPLAPQPEAEVTLSEDDAEAWEGYSIETNGGEGMNSWSDREEKRSPEASFGLKRIGMISIPIELENAMNKIIADSDKHTLRSDAKRLFLKELPRTSTGFDDVWTHELPEKLKGPKRFKSSRITPREGFTFGVVAMPAHYAAISNVLQELRGRLGQEWASQVTGFIEFGSATGSGIWAALDAFRKPKPTATPIITVDQSAQDELELEGGPVVPLVEFPLSESSIEHYLGLENRPGLLVLSEKLLRGVPLGSTNLQYEKFWGKTGHFLESSSAGTVAMAAFTLSDLPTDTSRRMMLREIWSTGAETMVIIDHGTPEGFKIVADAREYLLAKGKKAIKARLDKPINSPETEGTTIAEPLVDSHVVAPCPHDGVCPLTLFSPNKSTTDHCHFTQRLSRPSFLRLTKHAKKGQEDIQYSYVVIRRGPRPVPPPGFWDSPAAKEQAQGRPPRGERQEKGKRFMVEVEGRDNSVVDLTWKHEMETDAEVRRRERQWVSDAPPRPMEDIRAESYYWPRVIYPPLKRSGHVILDACTKEGNISRHTIPRSQGKQSYYDARKSNWGDAFPWEGKNGPDIRRKAGQSSDKATQAVDAEEEEAHPLEGMEGDYDVYVDRDGEMHLKKTT